MNCTSWYIRSNCFASSRFFRRPNTTTDLPIFVVDILSTTCHSKTCDACACVCVCSWDSARTAGSTILECQCPRWRCRSESCPAASGSTNFLRCTLASPLWEFDPPTSVKKALWNICNPILDEASYKQREAVWINPLNPCLLVVIANNTWVKCHNVDRQNRLTLGTSISNRTGSSCFRASPYSKEALWYFEVKFWIECISAKSKPLSKRSSHDVVGYIYIYIYA